MNSDMTHTGRLRRQIRVRKKIKGSVARPRLNVYRSNSHMYAQLIEDESGKTLATASTIDKDIKGNLAKTKKVDAAKMVGAEIAKKAIAKGIDKVVFDRGGFLYHGRIKAVADGAREAGLKF